MSLKDLIKRYDILKLKEDNKKIARKEIYQSRKTKSILNDIANEFVEFIKGIPSWKFEFMEDIFKFGRKIYKECRLSLKEIETLFNEVLPDYVQGGMLGSFISGLYHDALNENDVLRLDLRKYYGSISGLGYKHRMGILRIVGNRAFCLGFGMKGGLIEVEGNVGNYLGKYMEDGTVVVKGNARDWVGECMKGGKILIEGNAGNVVGEKMEGGEIVIEGNAGFWVGDDMRGGVIRIKGNVRSISGDRWGGKIYVWRNGWIEIERVEV